MKKFASLLLIAAAASATVTAPVATAAAAKPPADDHAGMGPAVDKRLIPAAAAGHAGPRERSVWRDRDTGADCLKGAPNCAVAPGNLPAGPHDIGAFRVPCDFAAMRFDDPIVFPGQPGASHLHAFFGNVAIDAFSSTASIAGTGNSSCAGGTLNRSGYWVPAMIDTATGAPVKSRENVVYYKGSYEFDIAPTVVAPPKGLRMVSGNPHNTDPKGTGARYICYGPARENPGWKTTITAAFADGTCKVGGDFVMNVNFPYCWDGKNLDSANHASHIVGPAQLGRPPWTKFCPATHPVAIPVISYNIHYTIPDDRAVSRWRLASDMDPALPAGISGHGDYWMGWDAKTIDTLVASCLRARMDCHGYLLGNGRTLY